MHGVFFTIWRATGFQRAGDEIRANTLRRVGGIYRQRAEASWHDTLADMPSLTLASCGLF